MGGRKKKGEEGKEEVREGTSGSIIWKELCNSSICPLMRLSFSILKYIQRSFKNWGK